jgi:hypothetical protein
VKKILAVEADQFPRRSFCPGSALGRHLMGSDEEQVGQSNNAQ